MVTYGKRLQNMKKPAKGGLLSFSLVAGIRFELMTFRL